MSTTVLIYIVIYINIRTRSRHQELSNAVVHRATPLMILYPLIYVICTSPLAIGRIAALTGTNISLEYFCTAGTMIACNGWLDVLLYASTRAEIVFSLDAPAEETGLETFAFLGKGHKMGTTTTIEAGNRNVSRLSSESGENLYGLNQITTKGAVTVRLDVVQNSQAAIPDTALTNWDTRSARSGKSGKSLGV